jgi:hypothetical protein
VATVLDLLTAALREIGVAGEGYSLSSSEGADGLDSLNRMLDAWAADRPEIYTVTRTTFTITSGTQDYAVGTAQVVNRARPMFVDHVTIQDTSPNPDVEISLGDILTDDGWASIQVKALTSTWPSAAYYNPTYPYGTISFWPIPTLTTLQGVLYAPTAVAQFAALTDTVALPPGYAQMIVKNLAVDLAPSFGRSADPLLLQQATQSRLLVKRSNRRLSDLSLDAAALIGSNVGASWDIYTGQ